MCLDVDLEVAIFIGGAVDEYNTDTNTHKNANTNTKDVSWCDLEVAIFIDGAVDEHKYRYSYS